MVRGQPEQPAASHAVIASTAVLASHDRHASCPADVHELTTSTNTQANANANGITKSVYSNHSVDKQLDTSPTLKQADDSSPPGAVTVAKKVDGKNGAADGGSQPNAETGAV
jgi:hypothetical protein